MENINAKCDCGWEGGVCEMSQEDFEMDELGLVDACPECGAVNVDTHEPPIKFTVVK